MWKVAFASEELHLIILIQGQKSVRVFEPVKQLVDRVVQADTCCSLHFEYKTLMNALNSYVEAHLLVASEYSNT